MTSQLKEIRIVLLANATASNLQFIQKIIPGEHRSYGVKTPVINKIVQQYKQYSFDLVESLWADGFLEERILAIKIMEKTGKQDPARLLKLFQKFSKQIGNWAVCDGLGMQFLRSIVKTHSEEIFSIAAKLNSSKDPWQRRLSLVMVEWYTREPGFHPAIKKLVKNLEPDEEYYVKKAVAWINRNFKNEKWK
jgi:3-methyladenine DNA glycosylase AlkD